VSRNQFHGFGGFGGAGAGKGSGEDADADEEIPRPEPSTGGFAGFAGNFPWSAFGFGGNAKNEEDANKYSNEQFGSVFEEMMQDEGLADSEKKPTSQFWSLIGAVSGGAMGFIVANLPGAIAGTVAGNRLGAVRDKRGKSVYSVFQELDQQDKMKLLGELASKVFAHAIS